MKPPIYFIIDFDSTFIKVEALDELANIVFEGHPDAEEKKQQIAHITHQGMDGNINVYDSICQRLDLIQPTQEHLSLLIEQLKVKVSRSFKSNKDFFARYSNHIYIVSNGFREFIEPVVTPYGIQPKNIFANTFRIDSQGNITGLDDTNPLSQNNGKANQIRQLNLSGEIYIIGDGYTDYEIKKSGLANKFYAFTENISRNNVIPHADHITPSLDEFLYLNSMNTTLSYPKNKIHILLLENIHPLASELLKEEGFSVENIPNGLTEDELCKAIANVSILGIRSKTQVTEKVLNHANRLMAIGVFCIGTNQIDTVACTKKGVAVFNAPYSNTRSVVELALAEIIMLMRNLPDKLHLMHQGQWNKLAEGSREVRGKKLGLVGYGNIGSQLSVLAENMGMKVYYYDLEEKLPLGNARKCNSLNELLEQSDVVSLHVDGRESNHHLMGSDQFACMKTGAIFLNLSRGHVVDMNALRQAILSKHIGGCAIDVFPYEPASNHEPFVSELQKLPNTILTPHIGGSTQEAQKNISRFVPNKLMDYINSGNTNTSVNFPNLTLPSLQNAHRFLHIHDNVPGVLAQINQTLARHKINIIGQYLKTNEWIGYVITDIDKSYNKDVIKDLRKIQHSIRFRVLY